MSENAGNTRTVNMDRAHFSILAHALMLHHDEAKNADPKFNCAKLHAVEDALEQQVQEHIALATDRIPATTKLAFRLTNEQLTVCTAALDTFLAMAQAAVDRGGVPDRLLDTARKSLTQASTLRVQMMPLTMLN